MSNFRQRKTIKSLLITLFIISLSGMLFAETIAQKTIRLKREKEAGIESEYQRNSTYTPAEETNAVPSTQTTVETVTETLPQITQESPKETVTDKSETTETKTAVAAAAVKQIVREPSILDIVPSETLVCARVNNLSESLSLLDDYLIGLSPMPLPLEILATSQLGNMTGNPMLTGVDTSGDFVICASLLSAAKEPAIVLMMPVTSFTGFISSYPANPTADADGIYTITISDGTNISAASSPDGKYAIVAESVNRQAIIDMLKNTTKESSLGYLLDESEITRSTDNPLWIYGNVENAVEILGVFITGSLQEMKQMMEAMTDDNTPMPNEQFIDLYFNSIICTINQIKSASITVTPSSDKLSVSAAVAAKPGSNIANALAVDATPKNNFELAGYLDQNAAMNASGQVNRKLVENLTNLFLENFSSMSEDFAGIEKLIELTNDAMAGEVAFSMSAADGPFPFVIKQIMRISKTDNIDLLIQQNFQANIEIYKLMGSADVDYDSFINSATSVDYKNIAVHSMKLPVSTMPNMTVDMSDISIDTNIAIIDDIMILTMGAKSLDEMYNLIDSIQSGVKPTISGDMARSS